MLFSVDYLDSVELKELKKLLPKDWHVVQAQNSHTLFIDVDKSWDDMRAMFKNHPTILVGVVEHPSLVEMYGKRKPKEAK